MSDSNKSRHGTKCKQWKDSVYESRSQRRTWAKKKKIWQQQERAQGNATVQKELDTAALPHLARTRL